MTERRPPATWYALDNKSFGRGVGHARLVTDEWDELRPWYDAVMRPAPVGDWREFRFKLRGGGFVDLQPRNRYFWLFSTRLRDLVVDMSPATPVEWLPLVVESEDGTEERTYWTPSFTEEMDVFQDGCVTRRDGTGYVISGYLDHGKAEQYRFIGYDHGDPEPNLYGHRELKKRAAAEKCDIGVKWTTVPSMSWHQDPATWNQPRRD